MTVWGLRLALCTIVFTLSCSSSVASVSPTPTTGAATPSAASTTAVPTIAATTTAPTAAASSAEGLADALASALAQSDYVRLQGLITPTGWTAGFYQSEGTKSMTPTETIDWLRTRASGGRIQAVVQPRPILPHAASQPPGDSYVSSTWTNFASTPSQKVELTLRAESGTWYWSGALFNAPAR
jgi:hypothetical protein